MYTGMLWFDNDPATTLSVKIQKAADYYRKKFGRVPDVCLVHPSMLADIQMEVFGENDKRVTIHPYKVVLPGHFWIGIEEQNP